MRRIAILLLTCLTPLVSQTHQNVNTSDWVEKITNKPLLDVREPPYSAVGNGVADDTAAIQAALTAARAAGGTCLYFSRGNYKTTSVIDLQTGDCLYGSSAVNRWRSTVDAVLISNYSAAVGAFRVAPGAGSTYSSIFMAGMRIDGTNAAGATTDGIVLDGTAAGANIEGLRFDISVTNFPRHQVYSNGVVFDVTFWNLAANNSARAADNLVEFNWPGAGGASSQIYFYNPYLVQYTAGMWAFHSNLVTNVAFFSGTVAPYDLDANGISASGGLDIYSTTLEGLGIGGTGVLVRYSGTNGARLYPSALNNSFKGIQIGDPGNKADPALGVIVSGNITGSATDLEIVDGGSRGVTVLSAGSPFVVSNLRPGVDGVHGELKRFDGTNNNLSTQAFSAGSATIYDDTPATGSSLLTVRAGAGQAGGDLQNWKAVGGGTVAEVVESGRFFVEGVYDNVGAAGMGNAFTGFAVANNRLYNFSSTAFANGAVDMAFGRVGPAHGEVNSGTAGVLAAFNAAPGGTVPAWKKYALVAIANGVNGCANANGCWQVNGVLGANRAASLTQDVVLFQLPVNGYVDDWRIKTAAACTGTTTATTGLGTTDNNVYYRAATYDIQAAPSATNKSDLVSVVGSTSTAAVNVVASLVTTAAIQFVDTLAAGCAVDYWVKWAVLP